MGKTHISKDLQKRQTSRSLLAVSLAASLAAVGCTTNLNPGNGTPTRSGPEIRSAPTSGVGSGSETVTPPPMTSSYTKAEVMPRVTPRRTRSIRRSADEAAAIMSGRQAPRGRYLGPANPGPGNRPYASDYAGGFVPPALLTNPQLTINSSISSPSTAAINSGAGGVAGVGVAGVGVATDAGVLAAGGVTTGTTAASNLTGTTGGVGGVAAATGTGAGLPAGTFAAVRPAVTESIGNNPGVTSASAGAGRPGVAVAGTTTTATTAGTATTAAAAARPTVTAAGTATSAAATGGVRVVRGSTGGVTITNTRNQ